MKLMKRAAALMLCLCLLIGLPISVQAVGTTAGNEFQLLGAYALNNKTAGWNSPQDQAFALYFNVSDENGWRVKGQNGSKTSIAVVPYKADGTTLEAQTIGGNEWISPVFLQNFGATKRTPLLKLPNASKGFSYWKEQGAVGFHLYIYDSATDAKGDNLVNGWTNPVNGTTKALKANTTYNGVDAACVDLLMPSEYLTVKQVVKVSDSEIIISFSDTIQAAGLSGNNGPLAIELRATNALNANLQATNIYRTWSAKSVTVQSDNRSIRVKFDGTAVADAMTYAQSNNYKLHAYIGENKNATNPVFGSCGECVNNGWIDGIWSTTTGMPLLAEEGKFADSTTSDATYRTIEESLQVESAEIREDNSLLIKFSQAVTMPTTAVTATLGLYNAQNQKHADYDWSVSVSKDTAAFYGSNQDAFVVTVPSTAAESIRSIAKGLESQGYTLRLTLTSHDGTVDGKISEIAAKDNADMKLLATAGGAADAVVVDVTCVETKLLKLEKVDAFKENTLVLTFNQDVVVNNGYYMGLTLVEDGGNCYQSYNATTGKYTIVRGNPGDGVSKPAQWNLGFKGYLNGQKNVVYATVYEDQGNFSSSVSTGWNLSKIMNFCEQYSQGKLMFRIQENNGNNSGTIDCIHADGDTANTLLSNFGNDQVHYEIADFRNDVIVESAKLIDGDLIEITFNKPITNTWYHATERGSAMLRLAQYNEAKGQWSWYRYDGKDAGTKYSDTPTQWGWGLTGLTNYNPKNTPTDAIPANTEASKVWYYKWNDGKMDVLDLLAMVEDPESVFAQDNVHLTLVLEKSGTEDKTLINCVQNFTAADGKYYLYDNDALQWRHHAAITTELAVPAMVKVTDVKINDESTMTVTFNKDIDSVKDIEPSIRLLDGSGTVKDQMILTVKTIEGNTVTFAARNSVKETYRNFSKVWQTADANGWDMQLALTQTSKSEAAKVKRDGMVNGVMGVDGSYLISSILSKDVIDAYYIKVDRNDYGFNPESFTITNAKQVGKSALIVEFSEDIQLYNMDAKPFIGLRMVDPADHEAIRLKSDGSLTKSASESKMVLQWGAQSVDFYGDRKDALLLTFADTVDIGLLATKVNMAEKFIPYEVMLCMEESSNDLLAPDRVKGNYLMHHIRRANDQKQVESSPIKNTNGGLNDAVLMSIQPLPLEGDLLVENVKILDQTRIVITFSEAVTINSPSAYIRLLDDMLLTVKNDNGTLLQWGGRITYYDEAKTQLLFTLSSKTTGDADAQASGLNDLFGRGYENDGKKLMLVIGDNTSKAYMNGVVDTIVSSTGKPLYADPMTGSYDALYLAVDASQIPQGELTITDVVVVSDIEAIITFSAPVEIVDGPYMALRLMTEDNFLISKSSEGKLDRHQKGYDPMQWAANWKWNNEEHTQIKMSIGNGPAGYENFSKMLSTDWESLFPGARITIGGEENNAAVIENNGRMDNIRLAADDRIRLTANSQLGTRDGCFIPLSKVDYTQKNLTGSARIINEMQIRISFSEPVAITDTPYISMRYIDEETKRVYYTGDEYNRAPVQFGGNWKWENDSHTSIIWTINSTNYFGPCNLYDVVNYQHALEMMTGRKMQLCIEEKSGKNVSVLGGNGLVDNISTLDKKNHLQANVSSRGLLDGLYMDLNLGVLRDLKPLTLVSATAINDQSIELKFSEPITMSADAMPEVMLRYMNEKGNADVLTNGKTANFKGDLAVKEGDPCVLVWTLNTKLVDNLTDLFNYNGIFKWNNTSKLVLVIKDSITNAPAKTMRLLGIMAQDEVRFLQAPYAVTPEIMTEVSIGYDIPDPEQTADAEQAPNVEYYSDYTLYLILGAVLITAGAVAMLIVCVKKKGGKA